jgi:hypothetical protein
MAGFCMGRAGAKHSTRRIQGCIFCVGGEIWDIRIGLGVGIGQKYPPIVARKVVGQVFDRSLSFILTMHKRFLFSLTLSAVCRVPKILPLIQVDYLTTQSQPSSLPPTLHPQTLTRNPKIKPLPPQTPRISHADFPTRRFDRSLPIACFAESFNHTDRSREVTNRATRNCEAEGWESGAGRVER